MSRAVARFRLFVESRNATTADGGGAANSCFVLLKREKMDDHAIYAAAQRHLEKATRCIRDAKFRDAISAYEEIGVLARRANDSLMSQNMQAASLGQIGDAYVKLGDLTSARKYTKHSLEISKRIGEPRNIAANLSGLGEICHAMSDYTEALQHQLEALALLHANARNWHEDARLAEAVLRSNIAACYRPLCRYDDARRELETSRDAFRKSTNTRECIVRK